MARLDVTQEHTAHLTIDVTGSFKALVMLGVGCYPSVFPERMDPDYEESSGGKETVSLSEGRQTVDILVGLNYYDKWQNSGWSGDLDQVLYVEDADTGDVILDDTEVDGTVELYKP